MLIIERTNNIPKNITEIIINNTNNYYCASWYVLMEVVELIKSSECKSKIIEHKNNKS